MSSYVQAIRGEVGLLGRRAMRALAPRPLILMYHRVADLRSDPQLLAVRPRHFAEHLEVLRREFRPVPLRSLGADLGASRIPRRTVVLTLDDGYADNLLEAKPLLERFQVSASVFVATGCLGQSREFWWDELERLVLLPGRLPASFQLALNGRYRDFAVDDAAEYSTDDYERDRWWHVEQQHDPGPRQRLYRELYGMIHPLSHADKWRILASLGQLAGRGHEARETHRALTRHELTRLADGELVEVGAHSVNHPALSALSPSEQREEIGGSRQVLRELLEQPVDTFAYPHGAYTGETLDIIREAGFSLACTSDPFLVARGQDPLRLPRLVPRDWDGETFARWLHEWLAVGQIERLPQSIK